MRRRSNPLALLIMIAIVVGVVVFAFIVKGCLPEDIEKWRSLIFWGIIAAGTGIGGFLCGKFLNRR